MGFASLLGAVLEIPDSAAESSDRPLPPVAMALMEMEGAVRVADLVIDDA